MTSARSYLGGAVVAAADANAHRVPVVGGWDSNGRPLDSCELYDAAADRWSMQDARLPRAMRCHAASIVGGSAVFAVQLDDPEKTRCALLDVRSSSSSWQPMAFPERSKHFSAVTAVGEHSVVMLSGKGTDRQTTDTAQLYDARADRWSERSEWRLPTPSNFHCAALIE